LYFSDDMQVTHRLVGASSNDGAEDGNERGGELHGGLLVERDQM
jgi:hypothetical protein